MISNDKTYILQELQSLIKKQDLFVKEQACNVSELELAKNKCELSNLQLKEINLQISSYQEILKDKDEGNNKKDDVKPIEEPTTNFLNLQEENQIQQTTSIDIDFSNIEKDEKSDVLSELDLSEYL